jgi:hypothetical protein
MLMTKWDALTSWQIFSWFNKGVSSTNEEAARVGCWRHKSNKPNGCSPGPQPAPALPICVVVKILRGTQNEMITIDCWSKLSCVLSNLFTALSDLAGFREIQSVSIFYVSYLRSCNVRSFRALWWRSTDRGVYERPTLRHSTAFIGRKNPALSLGATYSSATKLMVF